MEGSSGKGAGVSAKLALSQPCPDTQEGQSCPGASAQHRQPGQGGSVLLWGSLQCWGQLGAPLYKKDIKFRGGPEECHEEVKDLEGKPYEEWLTTLGLLSLEETEGSPHCGHQYLLTLMPSARTRGRGMKLSQRGLGWISGKVFHPEWLDTGTGSPGKRPEHQALPELSKSLDNTLRHWVGFLGCPVQGQQLDSTILMGPFQFSVFYNL